MLRVFGDFETYYSKEYTLRKLTPIEYILDNRFQMLCCGVAIDHETPIFMPLEESIKFFKSIKEPWAFISHNALFDACILAFRYNIHPDALVCTMSMARALLSHKLKQGRVSLANVMDHLGIGTKGDTIVRMEGKHYDDITPEMMVEFVGYNLSDTNGCREIFFRLKDQLPPMEAFIMDRVIRMCTQPKVYGDREAIRAYHGEVVLEKRAILSRVEYDKELLMSNPKFADLLRENGVEPPMKTSLTTGRETYAFAKTDAQFTKLLEHDDVRVQALVGARLGVKSTIEETRTQRFWDIINTTQKTFMQPLMPVPLKYSGAHTHRLSGDWKLNMQNLGARKTTRLRECLIAPMDHVILGVDASQIEARLVAWLAQQANLLNLFANKQDAYADFASDAYGYTVNKKDHPTERFTGKTCILGLGFGMGGQKLHTTLTSSARDYNIDATYTLDDCGGYVHKYREKFPNIKALWGHAQSILWDMVNGDTRSPHYNKRIGPCRIEGTTILLPSGLRLYYEGLAHRKIDEEASEAFWFTYGGRLKKTYGAKVIENVVQALDRQHTLESAVRTELRAKKEGIDGRIAMQVHDENLYVVDREEWRTLAQIAVEEMRRPCAWAECEDIALPLDAEVKVGENYGKLREVKM